MNMQRLLKPYMYLITALGVAACVYSAATLPAGRLDLRFAVLAAITVAISSRLTVMIPRISGHISVSDTFIFLTMLLYGGEAAVLLAATEALCSTLQFSRRAIYIRPLTIVFNVMMMAFSTFITAAALTYFYGDLTELPRG